MKTVLISGCSSGIGFALAHTFAKQGFQVIATMRNIEKAQALQEIAKQDNYKIDIRTLDVTDEQSVQTLVTQVLQDYQKIDVLINNAGAGLLGTLEQTSLAQAQAIMDVNFFGVWRLTQAVFPSMRQHKSGRIISVTSIGGVLGQPFNDAYCAAKFAVEGMMESLAPVAQRFGIQVALVEPGPVLSEFVTSVRSSSPALHPDLEKDYRAMLDAYLQAAQHAYTQLGQSSDEVAQFILDMALAEHMQFRYQTSAVIKQLAGVKFVDPTGKQGIELSGSRLPAL